MYGGLSLSLVILYSTIAHYTEVYMPLSLSCYVCLCSRGTKGGSTVQTVHVPRNLTQLLSVTGKGRSTAKVSVQWLCRCLSILMSMFPFQFYVAMESRMAQRVLDLAREPMLSP